jgi:hypothetical protein
MIPPRQKAKDAEQANVIRDETHSVTILEHFHQKRAEGGVMRLPDVIKSCWQ